MKRFELVIEATYQPDIHAQVALLSGLLVRLGNTSKEEGTPAPLAGTTDVPNRRRDRNGHTRR